MKQSKFKVAPPLSIDQTTLKDFSSVVQHNITTLFGLSHTHTFLTAPPTSNQGDDGDIVIVNSSGTASLYVKVPVLGWRSIVLS